MVGQWAVGRAVHLVVREVEKLAPYLGEILAELMAL